MLAEDAPLQDCATANVPSQRAAVIVGLNLSWPQLPDVPVTLRVI